MARQTGIPGGYVNQTATISTGFPGGYVNQTVAAIAVASDTTPEFGYQISSPSLVVYANVVAPQFGYQIQSVALASTITVTPATFGYQISSPSLGSVINVAPSTYGYQIKSVNLDVHIAPSTYGYQIQSVALSPTINVTPATFAYQIESVPLSQNNAINVTPATFAYQIESVALTPHINVTPATFGYQIESVPLSPIIDVTPATFAYQIESVPLTQNNVIVVKPSTYGFEITDPHLIQQHNLGVQDSTYGYQIESSPLVHFAHSHGSNRHITPQPWYDRKFIAKRNPGLAKIGVKYGLDRIVHVYGSQKNSRTYDVVGSMGKGIQRGKPVAPPIPRNFPISVQSSLYGWMDKPARLIPNLRPSGADYGRKHREVPLVAGFNVGPLTWGWRSNGPRLTQLLILGSTLTSGFTVTSPTLAQTSIVTPNAMTMGREIANLGVQITLKVNSPEFGKTIRSVGVINHVAGTGFKAGFTAGTPSIVQTLRPNQSDYGRQIGSVPVSINLLPNAAQFGFKTGIGAVLTQTAGTSKNVFGHQIKSVGLTFTNVLPTSNATFGSEIGNAPLSLNIKPNNATFGKQVGDGSMRSNLRIVSSDYGKEISTAAIAKNIVVTPATFGREITSTGQFPLASPAAMTTGFTTSQVKLIRTLNTTKNVFGFQAGSPSLTVHITDVKSAQFGYQVKSPAIQQNLKLKSFTQGYQISSPSVVHANVPISPFTKGIEMGTARLQLGFVPKPATFGHEIKSVALTHAQQIATTKMDMGHEHTSVYLRGAPVTLAWSSPANGSTLPAGSVTFTFVGRNFQNVAVSDGTGTIIGGCVINATRTVATFTFDASTVTGSVSYSAHAWNSPAGDGTFTSEADSGLRSFVGAGGGNILPPRILGSWYDGYAATAPSIASMRTNAPKYNHISYFVAVGDGTGSNGNFHFDSTPPNPTDLAAWKSSGRSILLGCGGDAANIGKLGAIACLNSTMATQMVNTIIPIIDANGFQGADFDLESGSDSPNVQIDPTSLSSVFSQLKSHYGSQFVIQISPRPFEIRDTSGIYWRVYAVNPAAVDLIAPQMYYGSTFGDQNTINQILSDMNSMTGTLGIPASKILMGCAEPPSGGPTGGVPVYTSAWNQALAAHSTLRGSIYWQSNADFNAGYPFGSQMGTAEGL